MNLHKDAGSWVFMLKAKNCQKDQFLSSLFPKNHSMVLDVLLIMGDFWDIYCMETPEIDELSLVVKRC